MADTTKDIYVDLQKAARLIEEAAKKVLPSDPLLKQLQQTRWELEQYTRELYDQMCGVSKSPKKIQLRK